MLQEQNTFSEQNQNTQGANSRKRRNKVTRVAKVSLQTERNTDQNNNEDKPVIDIANILIEKLQPPLTQRDQKLEFRKAVKGTSSVRKFSMQSELG